MLPNILASSAAVLFLLQAISAQNITTNATAPSNSTTPSTDAALDPCRKLAKAPTWKAAKACLESFPYDPTFHAKVADTVTKVAQMYAFADWAKDSPDKKYQPDYDLFGALNATFSRTYKNDMEFQEAVAAAFIPLNDAHTGYTPECYRQIIYSQPFYPVAEVGKDGVTRMYVRGIGKDYKPFERFLGAEIVEIEGKPAVDYVWDWATKQNNIGLNKDVMTRFNRAMARGGYSDGKWRAYAGYFMMRAQLPETGGLSYKLKPVNSTAVEELAVPWRVTNVGDPFLDAASYWRANCYFNPDGDDPSSEKKEKLIGSEHGPLLLNEDLIARHLPEGALLMAASGDVRESVPKDQVRSQVVESLEDGIGKPVVTGPGIGFYRLQSDDRIGVMMVTTFSPPFGMTSLMRSAIADVFKYINDNDIRKLIIDVSGNGGGSSCLASELVAVLTPHLWETFPVVQNQYLKDERLSPLTMKLHKKALAMQSTQWDPRIWISGTTKTNFKGEEMFTPRKRPHSKNDPFPYTQLFRDDCRSPDNNPLRNVTHHLKHEDIVIFSNGACGSACGRVHFHLSELDAVKSVVTGHFKGRERSASGFPATQVITYDSVFSDIQELGLTNDPDAYALIPAKIDLRFAARESYSRVEKNKPVEFRFMKADVEIDWDSWTSMRPDRAWEQAAVQLGWVPSWNKKTKAPKASQ